MQRFGMMTRVITVAMGVVLALAAFAAASAQQEPPHRFYGTGATPGDEIIAEDSDHQDLGRTIVADDGSWYIDVDRDAADDVHFVVNGMHVEADITPTGSGQSAVVLHEAMEDDGHMDEDGHMDDDGMMEDDHMDEESMEDDHMDEAGEDVGMPTTGTGGLADSGGVSAGLIGLLIALGAAAVAGIGLRRVRNRA